MVYKNAYTVLVDSFVSSKWQKDMPLYLYSTSWQF